MDNHFVPNLTWGPMFLAATSRTTYKQLWVHLMVDNPQDWLDKLTLPSGSIVSFHYETSATEISMINGIKEKDWLPSIAINPKTDVEKIFPFLEHLHQVLIMSVEPGFSGQKFLPEVVSKVEALNGYRATSGFGFTIGIDGGVNTCTKRR